MEISLLSKNDKKALFDFEVKNREWFTKFIPDRPITYFTFDSFSKIIDELIQEIEESICFLYVIYDGDKIVGRVNISKVIGTTSEIGYRIDKDYLGKGLASGSLIQLIDRARIEHQLTKLTAHTTSDNIASQKVLEKCGFKYKSTIKHGKLEFLSYEYLINDMNN